MVESFPLDRLTKYEVARIIGARALQISLGAPVLIKPPKEVTDPIDLAILEFKKGVVPLVVVRKLPNNKKVVVNMREAIKNYLKLY